MMRDGVKPALFTDKVEDPDDVSFSQSKPRPSQIQQALSWMDELGGRLGFRACCYFNRIVNIYSVR